MDRTEGLLQPRGEDPARLQSPPEGSPLQPRGGAVAQPPTDGAGLLRARTEDPPRSPDAGGVPPGTGAPSRQAAPAVMDRARIGATLKALSGGAWTLLELLFPELAAAELTRQPPDERAFGERLGQVLRDLDEADKDAGEEFSSKTLREARRHLERLRTEVRSAGGAEREAAAAQLVGRQRALLLVEVRRHALPGSKLLYASDILKIEAAAQELGFSPAQAAEVADGGGFTLLTTEARAWGCPGLPGSPTTLGAAADALLAHAPEAERALRAGEVSTWLASKGNAELAAEVQEHELALRNGGNASLAQHRVAWALGLRELRTEGVRARNPEDLGRLWKRGDVGEKELIGCARADVLPQWFTLHGATVLAARARFLAEHDHDPLALRQLRWAMGIAWELDGESFTDVRALADQVRASARIAQSALCAADDGSLAAWLESLPDARGEMWRAALTDPWFQAQGATCGFWVGVYRNARDRTLTLTRQGASEAIGAWKPLTQVSFAARYWDQLKPLRASGELVAFLLHAEGAVVTPRSLPALSHAESLDGSLNALLWELGMQGMVVEWGAIDRPVQAPEDLAELFLEDPMAFEGELAKGYPLAWLARRYRLDGREGAVLRFVSDVMVGRAPLGHAGAAVVALVRAGGPLPLDPRRPAEAAVVGVAPPGHPHTSDWTVIHTHLASGAALCWLAAQPQSPLAPLAEGALRSWHGTRIPPSAPALLDALRRLGALRVMGLPMDSSPPQPGPVLPPAPRTLEPSPPAPRSGGALVALLGTALLGAGLWLGARGARPTNTIATDAGGSTPQTPPTPPRGPATPPETPAPATAMAPTVPPPSDRCALDGMIRDVGQRAGPENGVELLVEGDDVFAGWVVRPRYDNGAENLALARLGRDGSVVSMPRPEETDPAQGNPVPRRRIGRVALVRTGGGVDARVDVNEGTLNRQTLTCSGLASTRPIAGLDGPTPDDWAAIGVAPPAPVLPQLPWMLYCRTLGETNPFVVGLNAVEGSSTPIARNGELFAARSEDPGARITLGTLSFSERATRTPDPISYIQEHTAGPRSNGTESEQPKGLTSVDVPRRGYAITFEHDERIYFAWLSTDLRLVGSLSEVHFPGAVRRPRLAVNGDRVLLVASADGHSEVMRAWGTTAHFGETPPSPRAALQTWAAPSEHAFDPAPIAIDDGHWLVAISQGADHIRRNGPPRNVVLQVFDGDLQPEGGPRVIDDPQGGYASVASLPGGRFMLAWLSGRMDRYRTVRVLTGSCSGAP